MTNLVVISFASQTMAIEGSQKLVDLEAEGDLTVYEKIIVEKGLGGDMIVVQSNTSEGVRLFSGMALGSAIGAFAGPVGLIIGMITGTLTGAALETGYDDFSDDFRKKVFDKLKPGEAAIIAEIYEENPAFLDVACERMGAGLFRSNVDYVHDEFVDDQVKEFDDEIAAERARIKSDVKADKEEIRNNITRLKEKRKQRISDLKAKQNGVFLRIKKAKEDRKKSRLIKKIYHYQTRLEELEAKLKEMEQ